MGKNKLQRFAENATYKHVVQPDIIEARFQDNPIKGNWHKQMFKNSNPIVVELGCGKGEYTVELARKNPNINYIGVDIKGARLWRGAKTSAEENLKNVAFLRTRIEFITRYFATDEVDEIWITFPDPQIKPRRAKNRLTHSAFLSRYQQFLKSGSVVHLKTDNLFLHRYTKIVLEHNNIQIVESNEDIYSDKNINHYLTIKTTYEQMFMNQGFPITYIKFILDKSTKITEPEYDHHELLRNCLPDSANDSER
ncbi:MAG TPA: tRNA (guanosine(46)-N7)-methyltransferase TrmB [Salinivirgaceae bacterium]|nr:tRNA (guanosine(46)-N7)-methyltransferase TrmB [Salinivirgaceae bacterium]HQA76100.1 tRNA (guanosine(46)-N7)-methyltransferase TrmB [Salinivirgaceae bacterium]